MTLRSVWQMLFELNAKGFVRILEILGIMQMVGAARDNPHDPLDDAHRTNFIGSVSQMFWECAAVGLDMSKLEAARIVEQVQKDTTYSFSDLHRDTESLSRRIQDELSLMECLFLSRESIKHYREKQPFGPEIGQQFPSAVVDIGESAKCLALGRSTAAVFHLMRVMECGLKAVAAALGIPYAPSWESYLKQIKASLETKWRRKPKRWREVEPFFRDVLAHLEAVKLAWRNPTMHVVRDYTPEMAEEVFNAVKGLMRHLSTRLSEEGLTSTSGKVIKFRRRPPTS